MIILINKEEEDERRIGAGSRERERERCVLLCAASSFQDKQLGDKTQDVELQTALRAILPRDHVMSLP